MFGFAIPISALPESWECLTLKTRYDHVLANGFVVLPRDRARSVPPDVCHIFLHVPKTAGTSLRSRLIAEVPRGRQCLLYPFGDGSSVRQLNNIPFHQRRQFRLVMGHANFGIHNYMGKPCRYVSFIREPMARLRSLYWHHRREGLETIKIEGMNVPLEAAANDGLIEGFDNHLVRIFAGIGPDIVPIGRISGNELELAIHNIRTEFDFVGTLEMLDKHAAELFKRMNLSYEMIPRENSYPYPYDYELDNRYRNLNYEKMKANNKYDLLLYRYIATQQVASSSHRCGRQEEGISQSAPASVQFAASETELSGPQSSEARDQRVQSGAEESAGPVDDGTRADGDTAGLGEPEEKMPGALQAQQEDERDAQGGTAIAGGPNLGGSGEIGLPTAGTLEPDDKAPRGLSERQEDHEQQQHDALGSADRCPGPVEGGLEAVCPPAGSNSLS
jgi:hypothetical protein